MRLIPLGAALSALLLASACSDDPSTTPTSPAPATSTTSGASTVSSPAPSGTTTAGSTGPVPTPTVAGDVATGLDVPWGLAFLPDRSALVSERDSGHVKRIAPNGTVSDLGAVPGVDSGGEGGLMGLAVAADFTSNPFVYAMFTAAEDNRIVRMRLQGNSLGAPDVVLDGLPKAGNHNGGRILFGPDGMLYIGTGEAGEPPLSQQQNSLGGKILRVRPDGGIPPDNPRADSPIWSSGHRNVQGLAFDPQGRLWAAEFGQSTWDELNLIRKGANYGWPEVEGRGGDSRFVDPVTQWRTSDASPSGIAFHRGAVWVAGLRGERLWRVPINGETAGEPTAFFTERYGRLRTVWPAPDGTLWLTTSNHDGRGSPAEGDDRILRLTLA